MATLPERLHTVVFENEKFCIPTQYQIIETLGRGASGIVVSALDNTTGEKVAIKKNKKVFRKDSLLPKRVLREILVLTHLHDHPNILAIKNTFLPKSYKTFRDVYIVTELMESDLRDLVLSKQELSDQHIQFIMMQCLSALLYCHSAGIIHRDIKPENILINSDCSVKIADFGLARGYTEATDFQMSTAYVQTRYYRAPELILDHCVVTEKSDIWSMGCIMAEILRHGQILFEGKSPLHQMERIIEILGTPSINEVKGSPQGIEFISGLKVSAKRDIAELLPLGTNPLAVDVIQQMLTIDPEKRPSAEQLLQHEYFADMLDEFSMMKAPFRFDNSFEDETNDLESIKSACYHHILRMNDNTPLEEQDLGISNV